MWFQNRRAKWRKKEKTVGNESPTFGTNHLLERLSNISEAEVQQNGRGTQELWAARQQQTNSANQFLAMRLPGLFGYGTTGPYVAHPAALAAHHAAAAAAWNNFKLNPATFQPLLPRYWLQPQWPVAGQHLLDPVTLTPNAEAGSISPPQHSDYATLLMQQQQLHHLRHTEVACSPVSTPDSSRPPVGLESPASTPEPDSINSPSPVSIAGNAEKIILDLRKTSSTVALNNLEK